MKKRLLAICLVICMILGMLPMTAFAADVSRTYQFSNYTAGTQYATNEEHKLDNEVMIVTTECHFTTELRIYSSSTHDGYAIIQSSLPIKGFGMNAGNKSDSVVIYGSNDDGASWTEVTRIAVSTSYKDYSYSFGSATYKWLKLDVAGSNQIRIKSMTLTVVESGCNHTDTTTTTVDPKCTEEGSETVTCNDCGAVISDEVIPATGHNYVNNKCTKCGYTLSGYVLMDLKDITANHVVIVTMTYTDGTVYALSNDKGTGGAPTAIVVHPDNNIIPMDEAKNNILWKISADGDNLTFYPNGSAATWLYCTSDNNGVRVGTNTNKVFTVDTASGYLKHTGTGRYLGVYRTNPDWRCYTSVNNNIADQALKFYAYLKSCEHTNTTETTVDATCTEAGSVTVACGDCGVIISTEEIPVIDHTYKDGYCSCGAVATYTVTLTEYGSVGGNPRLNNQEKATHGKLYEIRIFYGTDIDAWYTDVVKVTVGGVELTKGVDYSYDLQYVRLSINADKVTGPIEIFAQVNAKVTFDLNGGELEPNLEERLEDGGLTVTDGKIAMPLAYGTPSSFGTTVEALNRVFLRTGYTCTGLKNGNAAADLAAPITNCTLTVQWQANTYTVTWNVDGTETTTTQTYAEKLVLPETDPAKTGYIFAGWYTAAEGGEQVSAQTEYTTAGETTYYAQWTKCDHQGSTYETITDNGNGTHTFTCTICEETMTEDHFMKPETGKCSCGLDMAVASTTVGGTTTYYATLKDAIAAAAVGTEDAPITVAVLKDIDMTETIDVVSGVFTLNLNGMTLRDYESDDLFDGLFQLLWDSTAHMTIADTEGGKLLADWGVVAVYGGTVTITGGAFDCEGTGLGHSVGVDGGTVNISGGTIHSMEATSGTVNISGGSIESSYLHEDTTLNISGGTIWHLRVESAESNVKISGGAFERIYCVDAVSELLADGYSYWTQDGITMLNPAEDTDIFRVTVKATCYHPTEKLTYVTCDSSTHTWHCTDCNNDITKAHTASATYALTADGTQHIATYGCCNGTVTEAHTVEPTYVPTDDGMQHIKKWSCCNTTVTEEHTLTYTADDDANTITESCDKGCGYSNTITLKAPEDFVFDGYAHAATVEGTIHAEYDLTYSETPVCPGTYTVTLSAGGTSVSLEYTIEKADPTYTAPTEKTNLVYNGTAQELVSAGSTDFGTMVYSLTEDGEFTTTIPTGTDAGSYTVYYYVKGNENVNNTAVASVLVNIDKAKAVITVDTTTISVTCTETVTLPSATTNFGTVLCDKTASELVDAGTYTVTYSVEGTDNYESATQTLTVIISHDYEAVVTAPDCENGGYTTYTCTVCGDSYVGDETPALGHDLSFDCYCGNCGEYIHDLDENCLCARCACYQHTPTSDDDCTCLICGAPHAYLFDNYCMCDNCREYIHDLGEYCTCTRCGEAYHSGVDSATGNCVDCGQFVAAVSVTADGAKTYYFTFKEGLAVAQQNENCTLRFENDFSTTDSVYASGTFTIDLNGKRGFNSALHMEAGYVTLCDSVGGGDYSGAIIADGGTLRIESGYYSTYINCKPEGNVIITGGEIGRVYFFRTGGSITIYGGSFDWVWGDTNHPLDSMLADGHYYYDADNKKVDTASIEMINGKYMLEDVTVSCDHMGNTQNCLGYLCERCGEYFGEGDPNGHEMVGGESKVPTCEEPGFKSHVCNICGHTETVETPATGHDWKPATCSAPETCGNCGETRGNVKDHAWGDRIQVTAPTCEDKGVDKVVCGDCGAVSHLPVDALGHEYEGVVTAPTCTEKGYTTYTCTVCGDSYVGDEVSALGHEYEAVVTEPDCVNDGYTTYTCTVCGNSYVGDETLATGHSYEGVVTDPDCKNGGYTTYTCTACGDSYVADEVPALGHKYEGVVTDPDCTEYGYTTYTCANCGDSYKDDITDPLGHKHEATEVVAPDCENEGYTVYTCSACGHSYIADYTQPLDHKNVPVYTAPDCENSGYTTYTCAYCGDSYVTNEVPALGHDYQHGTCDRCGAEDPEYVAPEYVQGMTMTLGNSLAVNFVVDEEPFAEGGYYAVITKQYADGTTPITVTVPQSDWAVYDEGRCYFTFFGVKAKEMTDTIEVLIYNADGKLVCAPYERTVADYCLDMVERYEQPGIFDAERLALYVDILNYGAAAQDFFGYNTEDLANADLTDAQRAYASKRPSATDIRVKGAGYAGSTLSLLNEIQLNFVYNNNVIDKAAYAVVSYTHHCGAVEEYTVEAADFQAYGTMRKYVEVNGLKIADGGQVVTVTLYDASGNVLSVSQDSMNAYAVRKGDEHPVYDAVLKLTESAYNYFH